MTGWTTVTLGEILTPRREPVPVEEDQVYEQVTVRIRGRGLTSRGKVHGRHIRTRRFAVAAGQLLVSKIGAGTGALGLVPPELDGALISDNFVAFDIARERCHPQYLNVYVNRPTFWERCALVSEGSTGRARLVLEQFLDLAIELPPLEEQRRIVEAAAAMEQATTAHEHYANAAFAALRAAREALLFTKGGWTDLPPGWELRQLDEIADIRVSGITKGRKVRGPLSEVPSIRAANVQDGFLDLSEVETLAVTAAERERFRLQPHDILMVEGGNARHVGRGWLWEGPGEAVCQRHVFLVRVTTGEVMPRFLAYAIGASPAREYCYNAAKTTAIAHIGKSEISELAVPVPPVPVQADVVRKLDALRRVGVAQRRRARRLASFRAALVEELLTGGRAA